MGKKLDPVDWRVLSKQMLNWACFYPTSVLNTQSGQNTDYKIPNLANSQFIPFWAFWLRWSAVSVLIDLISDDTCAIGSHDIKIKLIFLGNGSYDIKLIFLRNDPLQKFVIGVSRALPWCYTIYSLGLAQATQISTNIFCFWVLHWILYKVYVNKLSRVYLISRLFSYTKQDKILSSNTVWWVESSTS